MKKKTLALILALVMVFGAAVGGTIAYLTDKTEEVKNTFTVGNINIDLDESKDLDLKMVPGKVITKDPTATVKANSEACWLFVKIVKGNDFDKFMTYSMASGWTQLTTSDGSLVFYREVASSENNQTFGILADNHVTVKTGVTKTMMDDLTTDTDPTLTFTAYAIQKAGFDTASAAWAEVSK